MNNPDQRFWRQLARAKSDVAAWPNYLKRALGAPLTRDPRVDDIIRRWHTNYDRGAHDYTDEGCRILAEHAFRDVNYLLDRFDARIVSNQDSSLPRERGNA